MNTRMRLASTLGAALLCLSSLAGCGATGVSEDDSGIAGVYGYDVETSTGVDPAATGGAAGNALLMRNEAAEARLVESLSPEAYLLTLRQTGTFELRIVAFGELFLATGIWARTAEGVQMVTEAMNGEPVEPDVETASLLRVEGERLVIDEGQKPIYLKRL